MAEAKKPARKASSRKKSARKGKNTKAGPIHGRDVEDAVVQRIWTHGRRAQAAEEVGIALSTIIRWENPNDSAYRPDFARRMAEAIESYRDWLVKEAERRAVHGWIEPVYGKDGLLGHVRKFDSKLLELLLKRHIPEFRDKSVVEHQHTHNVRVLAPEIRNIIDDLDREGRAALRLVLQKFEELEQRKQLEEGAKAQPQIEAGDVMDAEFEAVAPKDAERAVLKQEDERAGLSRSNPGRDGMDPRDLEALHGFEDDPLPRDDGDG